MYKFNWIIISILIILLYSCNQTTSNKYVDKQIIVNSSNTDSIELTELIRQAYKWHMSKSMNEFPLKYEDNQDSIFTGIDWEKYNSNIQLFKRTNYFTQEFLEKHKSIALTLDSSIRKADISWRNIKYGITIWDTEVDDWTGCQDYPDNFWETLTIGKVTIKNNYASFKWSWGKESDYYYKVITQKQEGKWRISSLQGYQNYRSMEQYERTMKNLTNTINE